jgi:hypothetical protein
MHLQWLFFNMLKAFRVDSPYVVLMRNCVIGRVVGDITNGGHSNYCRVSSLGEYSDALLVAYST